MAKKKTLEIELRVFDMATKEFNALDRSLRNIGKTVGQVSAIAVGALSTVGFVTYRMGKGFVEAASDVEGFEVRLTTALRSLDKAKELMSWITAFAASTPFEIPELVETSILLENVGMSAKDNLETIGNTAAAMGRNIFDTATAVISMEKKVLRNYGIDMRKEGDKATFLWKDNTGKIVETVAKGGDAVIRETLLSIWNDRYQGGMDRFTRTWQGMVSNMQDNFFQFKKDIGEGGLFDAVKGDLGALLTLIDRSKEEGGEYAEIVKHTSEHFVALYDSAKEFIALGVIGAGWLIDRYNQLGVVYAWLQEGIVKLGLAGVQASRGMLLVSTAGMSKFTSMDKQLQATIDNLEIYAKAAEKVSAEALDDASVSYEERFAAEVNALKAALNDIKAEREKAAADAEELMAGEAAGEIDIEKKKLEVMRELWRQHDDFIKGGVDYRMAILEEGYLNDYLINKRWVDDKKSLVDSYVKNWELAHESMGQATLKVADYSLKELRGSILDIAFEGKKAADVILDLGQALLKYIADYLLQRGIAWAMTQALEGAIHASQAALAAATAAEWAPAAAMVSLATMGANAAPAMTGLTSTVTFAQALALPKMAEGAILTGPTRFIGGEAGDEAVLPLSRNRLNQYLAPVIRENTQTTTHNNYRFYVEVKESRNPKATVNELMEQFAFFIEREKKRPR